MAAVNDICFWKLDQPSTDNINIATHGGVSFVIWPLLVVLRGSNMPTISSIEHSPLHQHKTLHCTQSPGIYRAQPRQAQGVDIPSGTAGKGFCKPTHLTRLFALGHESQSNLIRLTTMYTNSNLHPQGLCRHTRYPLPMPTTIPKCQDAAGTSRIFFPYQVLADRKITPDWTIY